MLYYKENHTLSTCLALSKQANKVHLFTLSPGCIIGRMELIYRTQAHMANFSGATEYLVSGCTDQQHLPVVQPRCRAKQLCSTVQTEFHVAFPTGQMWTEHLISWITVRTKCRRGTKKQCGLTLHGHTDFSHDTYPWPIVSVRWSIMWLRTSSDAQIQQESCCQCYFRLLPLLSTNKSPK